MLFALKDIRKKSGYSQKDAAIALETPLGTYRNWEQCLSSPRDNDTLKRIADLFHTSIESLFGYDVVTPGSITTDSDLENSAFSYVPIYGRIAAGHPMDWENIDGHFPIPNEVMKLHKHAFLLLVEGESMNRVLPNGSYALIDPDECEPVINYCAYAVCVNGYSATIKRIHLLENGIELIPDSTDPTFRAVIYDFNDETTESITLIGRVVWYTIPFDFEI